MQILVLACMRKSDIICFKGFITGCLNLKHRWSLEGVTYHNFYYSLTRKIETTPLVRLNF